MTASRPRFHFAHTRRWKELRHDNIARLYASFVSVQRLYLIVQPHDCGSALDLIKYKHKDGFAELDVCVILREALQAIEYLHTQGKIHR